jgi:hypothetical protein
VADRGGDFAEIARLVENHDSEGHYALIDALFHLHGKNDNIFNSFMSITHP